jgi:hypothetical protein
VYGVLAASSADCRLYPGVLALAMLWFATSTWYCWARIARRRVSMLENVFIATAP